MDDVEELASVNPRFRAAQLLRGLSEWDGGEPREDLADKLIETLDEIAAEESLLGLKRLEDRILTTLHFISENARAADQRNARGEVIAFKNAIDAGKLVAAKEQLQRDEAWYNSALEELKRTSVAREKTQSKWRIERQKSIIKQLEEYESRRIVSDFQAPRIVKRREWQFSDDQRRLIETVIPSLRALKEAIASPKRHESAVARGVFALLGNASETITQRLHVLRSALRRARPVPLLTPSGECFAPSQWRALDPYVDPGIVRCWKHGDLVSAFLSAARNNGGRVSVACCGLHCRQIWKDFRENITCIVYESRSIAPFIAFSLDLESF